jgi:GTP-binding protein HflX
MENIGALICRRMIAITLLLPYNDSGILARLYKLGAVKTVEYTEKGIIVQVSVQPADSQNYQQYLLGEQHNESN